MCLCRAGEAMSIQEKLVEAIAQLTNRPNMVADAVIAAMPNMIEPLVWFGAVSALDNGCYYTAIPSKSGKSVCVDYVCRGASIHIGYYPTPEADQQAANAHHRAQIMAAFVVKL